MATPEQIRANGGTAQVKVKRLPDGTVIRVCAYRKPPRKRPSRKGGSK